MAPLVIWRALIAMPLMAVLSQFILAPAEQLGSHAMRADAVESITCGWLFLVVVVGLLTDWLTGHGGWIL